MAKTQSQSLLVLELEPEIIDVYSFFLLLLPIKLYSSVYWTTKITMMSPETVFC